MTTIKFISAFLLIAFYSCGQNTAKQKVDTKVTILANKIVPLVNYTDNPDSCRQALLYLDSATNLDNNCFSCYYNKLMFLSSLKQFDKAVETMNECIRIEPTAHDLYLTGGILYEKVGDTASSKKYFEKSLIISSKVLDTMNRYNSNYEMLMGNKAITLVMLGDTTKAKETFRKLSNGQSDNESKQLTLILMKKNKKELIEQFTVDKYSR